MNNNTQNKILFWDLETTNLDADFGYLLCFGYKWLGDKRTTVLSVLDYPAAFRFNPTNDKNLVKDAYTILKSADLWVTWYGKRFDVPFFNSRVLKHIMPPLPQPFPHVDGWEIAKTKLKLHSNRLASVSAFLNLEDKTPVAGTHWVEAAAGRRESLKYVIDHCHRDVEILEQAYHRLKTLTTNHPNLSKLDLTNKTRTCQVCSSVKIAKEGIRVAINQVFQRYRCGDCGSWGQAPLKERGAA